MAVKRAVTSTSIANSFKMSVGQSSAAIPNTPTIGTATKTGTSSATVTYTSASLGATATSFTATSNPGSITGSSATSPITVSGLSSSTNYTFTVTATNSNGTSTASAASNQITTDVEIGSPASGMTIWLDADDASTITSGSGNGISQWRDKSGNNYSWSMSTSSKQPQRGTRFQNGRNVLDFNGGFGDKQALTMDQGVATHKFTTDGDASFFIAFLSDQSPAPGVFMTNNPFGSPGNGFFWSFSTNGRLDWYLYPGVGGGIASVGAGFTQPTGTNNTFYVGSVLTDPGNGTAANRSFVRYNKGTVYNQNTSTQSPSTGNPSGNLTIGGSVGAVSNGDYFDGIIGEIIIYNTKLSNVDRDKTIDYLMAKWGVS